MLHRDPNNPNIKFKFTAWNFAQAELAIQSVLEQKDSNLSTNETEFLKQLLDELKSFSNQIISLYSLIPLESNINSVQRVERYFAKQSIAFEIIQETTLKIINLINSEQLRYDLLMKENTKNSYLIFLNLLKKCCKGMFHRSEGKNNWYNDTSPIKNVAVRAQAFGGIFIPKSQCFDPLRGSSKRMDGIYNDTNGYCAGDVYEWIAQRKESSDFKITPVLTASIYQKQQNQTNLRNQNEIWKTISLTNIPNQMADFLNNLGNDIYHISIRHRTRTLTNHAIAIRKIIETDEIELFDPNHGIFIFKNDIHFHHFFAILMYSAYKTKGYTELVFRNCGKQPISGQTRSAYTKDIGVDFLTSTLSYAEQIEIVIDATNDLYKHHSGDDFHEMSSDQIIDMLVDIIPCYLHYAKSVDDINFMQYQLLKLNFIFEKKFISSLFHLSSNDPWQATSASKKIAQMLMIKKKELQEKDENIEINSYFQKFTNKNKTTTNNNHQKNTSPSSLSNTSPTNSNTSFTGIK